MATIKKTIKTAKSKKPAAKKPAVKKPVAKKPAAKKPAVKKPAAKKPAVKKPVAKKPAAKKPAAKKPAAKKPAAKPAAKKAAVKPAAKPVVAKKEVPKAVVEKKPVVQAEPKEQKPATPAVVRSRNLFDAFAQGKLPFDNGYIVSSFFSESTAYSIYEIVSYAGVKEIFNTDAGLQFTTGGQKLYILVEPATYHVKHEAPVNRVEGEKIPKRFEELEIITASNQTKIMVSKEPDETLGSFTILKPKGINFAVIFYQLPDVFETLTNFFKESFNKQRKIPEHDAKKAAKLIVSTVEKYMSFKKQS